MYMNITKILNSGSFAGFVRDGVEKKSDFQFSILPNLSRFPDRKNKDTWVLFCNYLYICLLKIHCIMKKISLIITVILYKPHC